MVLSRIFEVVKEFDRDVLAVVLFGSYVYNPRKSRDIDILVIVDKVNNIHEKISMERAIIAKLRSELRRSIDAIVLDIDSFKENLVVGSFLSGLVLGYRVLHDVMGLDRYLKNLFKELAKDSYIYVKKRRWNLSAIARAKIRPS